VVLVLSRCSPGARGGHQGDVLRGHLAAVSYPLSAGSLGQGGGVASSPRVATVVRTIFDQPGHEEVEAQFDRVVDALASKLPEAAEHLEEARCDLLAFRHFRERGLAPDLEYQPFEERLHKEIRRRTNVVGIFPNRGAIIRLVGALLIGETEEWTEQRRYMSLEALRKVQPVRFADTDDDTEHALLA